MPARVRPAKKGDAAQLAVLMDMASEGLVSRVWMQMAAANESPFEIGRTRITGSAALPSHYSNWTVAEMNGDVAGGFAGYHVPEPYDPGDTNGLPAAYGPLLELEALAAGNWFLAVLAVFPEFRRRGLAKRLLIAAEKNARAAGATAMALTVSRDNDGARTLYLMSGFSEEARRRRILFNPEEDCADEWILMTKVLSR